MKYLVTWRERPTGSASDYEAAQKRVLDVFSQWKMPDALTFHEFLVRVGEFGGYGVVETDDVAALHYLTSAFAVFEFKVEAVIDVMDAVAVEAEAISWRDALQSGS
jgi:muconolactone delta-isomerase